MSVSWLFTESITALVSALDLRTKTNHQFEKCKVCQCHFTVKRAVHRYFRDYFNTLSTLQPISSSFSLLSVSTLEFEKIDGRYWNSLQSHVDWSCLEPAGSVNFNLNFSFNVLEGKFVLQLDKKHRKQWKKIILCVHLHVFLTFFIAQLFSLCQPFFFISNPFKAQRLFSSAFYWYSLLTPLISLEILKSCRRHLRERHLKYVNKGVKGFSLAERRIWHNKILCTNRPTVYKHQRCIDRYMLKVELWHLQPLNTLDFRFTMNNANTRSLFIHNKSQAEQGYRILSPMQERRDEISPCYIFNSDRMTSLSLFGHCHGNCSTRQIPFAPIHFLWLSMNMILGFLSSPTWAGSVCIRPIQRLSITHTLA